MGTDGVHRSREVRVAELAAESVDAGLARFRFELAGGSFNRLARFDPKRMLKLVADGEIAFDEERRAQTTGVGTGQDERGDDAQAQFHPPAAGRHGKALDEDAIGAAGGDEHRVASALDDFFVGGFDLAAAAESGFAFFAIDPQGEPGDDSARRQLDLGARLALQA